MRTEEQKAKQRAASAKWRAANPEKAREAVRTAHRNSGKTYYDQNADYYKEKARIWRAGRDLTSMHQAWRCENPAKYLLGKASTRAKRLGREFTITEDDIVIPTHCPVFGIELVVYNKAGSSCDNTMSIDRIDSTKGYIPGNVIVVSWKANNKKGPMSIEKMKVAIENYKPYRYKMTIEEMKMFINAYEGQTR